jgi:putative cell wall-binding protein
MMRLLIVLAVLLAPTAVLAQRQCTVTGNVTIDSSDNYYCDTTWGNNCAGPLRAHVT